MVILIPRFQRKIIYDLTCTIFLTLQVLHHGSGQNDIQVDYDTNSFKSHDQAYKKPHES